MWSVVILHYLYLHLTSTLVSPQDLNPPLVYVLAPRCDVATRHLVVHTFTYISDVVMYIV